MVRSAKKSAAGERTAIGGYFAQYEYSACVIYRLMQDGELKWVSIADDKAGIFDDLMLGVGQIASATQVKSESDLKPVLLSTQLVSKKLFKEIAASWESLEKVYGKGKVRLNYIFGGHFSTNDRTLAVKGANGPCHSSEFSKFVNRHDLTSVEIGKGKWKESFRKLREQCGLDNEEFVRLINCLKIHDYRQIERHRIDSFPPNERQRIAEIRDLIPNLIARKASKSKWTEAALIGELGWRSKLSQRNYHEFPIPEDFQDNEETRNKLLGAINSHKSGYIGLVGPPGTGKSTILQRAVFSTPDIAVARYLAFLPDSRHGLGRAEAAEFLNDITAELRGLGLSGSRFVTDDLAGLRQELLNQLEAASRRYSDRKIKTVIIVDGLDHVPREENPQSSFLKELPNADSVPAGVLFVLGTQHLSLDDLKATVRQQAQRPDRCISVTPLSRSAIFAMAEASSISPLVERDELYDACAGHPLTARYFIEALRGVTDAEVAKRILSHADGLGRGLEEIYERVWKGLKADSDAKRVMGLLARAEGSIASADLAGVTNEEAVENVIEHGGFLLDAKDSGTLSIFHNSFRLFTAEQTRIRYGRTDDTVEQEFNRELAEIASQASSIDPQHWLELRYRSRSGDGNAVLRIGTPNYFRQQLREFRPAHQVYVDLRLTYAATKPTGDRVLLLNKLLIEKEIEYRLEAVRELDLVEVFLDLQETDMAISHAIDGSYSGEGWQNLVDHLWVRGRYSLARKVFEANEPLKMLLGHEALDGRDQLPIAKDWIEQAHRFRPIDQLVSIAETLQFEPRLSDGKGKRHHRSDLLYSLARGIVLDNPTLDTSEICSRFELNEGQIVQLKIEAARAAQDGDNTNLAVQLLQPIGLMANLELVKLPWRRLAVSLALNLGQFTIAKSFLETLRMPSMAQYKGHFSPSAYEEGCRVLYNTAVWSNTIGMKIQSDDQPEDHFLRYIQNNVIELASLRVLSETKDKISAVPRIEKVIRFFAYTKPDDVYAHNYRFRPILGWFSKVVVDIAYRFESEVFSEVIDLLTK